MAAIATQLDRTRRLAGDLARLVASVARAARYAVAPPPDRPGIAVLAGDELARRGVPCAYRVRLHNPTATTARLALAVSGRTDPGPPRFTLRTDLTLGPDGVDERWVVCTWPDVAVLVTAPPDALDTVWLADAPSERWAVEATLSDASGSLLDRLEIGGHLVA